MFDGFGHNYCLVVKLHQKFDSCGNYAKLQKIEPQWCGKSHGIPALSDNTWKYSFISDESEVGPVGDAWRNLQVVLVSGMFSAGADAKAMTMGGKHVSGREKQADFRVNFAVIIL